MSLVLGGQCVLTMVYHLSQVCYFHIMPHLVQTMPTIDNIHIQYARSTTAAHLTNRETWQKALVPFLFFAVPLT